MEMERPDVVTLLDKEVESLQPKGTAGHIWRLSLEAWLVVKKLFWLSKEHNMRRNVFENYIAKYYPLQCRNDPG